MAAGDAWVPHDRHDEFTAASLKRPFNPCPLPFVDRAQDSCINRQQSKSFGLQLKERASLAAHTHSVETTQTGRFGNESLNAMFIGASQSKIGVNAGFHCCARSLGFEEVRIESFKRVEPVVVTRNRIDRLREPLKGKIEIRLVVMHRSCRIDDVGGYDQKFHVIMTCKLQIA